ncbi:serine/threonine protein kinase (plasmid) [[Synechococcus] sp. NIES-970]|nr:serine/threonine protein kinase [[Synechococcus] sp. NIES-970]
MKKELLEGRYRILRGLGQGGFGDTFLAEDLHMPSKRRCVIKRLKPIVNDPVTYQLVQDRFEREAVLLEKLGENHPQIPCLYAYLDEAGKFYLIQEWVEGETLADIVLHQGPWSSKAVKELLLGILPVLKFIHDQGIVHRDIKPENIILRRSDRQPVLIDFGAVKETMNATNSRVAQSKSIVIGTPGFMAPEQGIGRPVLATDLYSLGLTAIFLLTGKLPQELPSDPQTRKILWRPWFQEENTVDEHLTAVLEKAIQPQLQERFQDVSAMVAALQTPMVAPMLPPVVVPLIPQPQTSHQATITVGKNQRIPVATGMADWQKAVLTGSVVGVFLLGGVVLGMQMLNRSGNLSFVSPQSESTESPISVSRKQSNTPIEVSLSFQESCGDLSSNANTWYRVIGDRAALDRIKSNYCGDAFLRKDGVIQIASFTSRDSAQGFVNQLAQATGLSFRIQEAQRASPSPKTPALSENQAADLVVNWLDCKQELFEYPYNRSCGTQILTGKAFSDNIRRNDGQQSSMEWLKSNGSHYAFANQVVEEVRNLNVVDSQQAIADVVVTEQRTLYTANGNIDRNASGYDQRLVRYNLQRADGTWKIADYNTLEVLWRR